MNKPEPLSFDFTGHKPCGQVSCLKGETLFLQIAYCPECGRILDWSPKRIGRDQRIRIAPIPKALGAPLAHDEEGRDEG